MARIEWVEQRLQNWARWRVSRGIGMLGYAAVALGDALLEGQAEGYEAAPVPISDLDASETQEAVDKLPADLKDTVEVHYLANVGFERKLQRLGIAKRTFYDRIEAAQRMLIVHFTEKNERRKAERARVEALRDSVRPC